MCLSYLLVAAKQGVAHAAGYGLYAAALTVVAIIPVWEMFDRPKSSQIGAAVLFALLGKLSLRGSVSPFVSAACYLLTGWLIYFTPKQTAALYEVSKPLSELAYSMLSLYGGMIGTCGVLLASLAYGLTQPQAFAAAFLTNALLSLKWAVAEAGKLEAPKVGAFAWAFVSVALSALALK